MPPLSESKNLQTKTPGVPLPAPTSGLGTPFTWNLSNYKIGERI